MNLTWTVFWDNRTWSQKIAAIVAIVLAVFQIYTALFGSLDALKQRAIHLGLGLILIFLVYGVKEKIAGKGPSFLNWICIGLSITAISYLLARYEWITVERFTLITPMAWYEKLLGISAIVLVLE